MLTPDVTDWLIDKLIGTSAVDVEYIMAKRSLMQLIALASKDVPEESPIVDTIKRTVFMVFDDSSKSVAATAKYNPAGPGQISLQVTFNIPLSLFQTTQLKAQVNLPPGGVGEDVIIDLENALSMSYGKKIQLIVEPTETV